MDFIPGREIFAQRSGLNKPLNCLFAILTIAVTLAIIGSFFFLFDGLFTGSTLVSEVIIIGIGQLLAGEMIVQRAFFKERFVDHAYSAAFRWLLVPGLTFIGAGVAHFAWIEGARFIPHEIALLPFLYLLVSGILLWLRAVMTFGIDNLSLLYVYYPEESRLVHSNVYSVLRHPVYSAVLRVIFALVLWNGGKMALLAGFIAPVALMLWVKWAEEPELIERFGAGYREYRRSVPAFFNLDPRTWAVLWRFLIFGK